MGKEVLNIFSSNNFFDEGDIFRENSERKFLGNKTIFWGDGVILRQNEYNLFYHKLDAKYFHVKQFFRKKQYFLEKPSKNCFGGALGHFVGKGDVLHKKLM